MSVKVSLSIAYGAVKDFPKLMIDKDGLIVLFSSDMIGVVVKPDTCRGVGYYDDTWFMSYFKDYEGEVTLKNKYI